MAFQEFHLSWIPPPSEPQATLPGGPAGMRPGVPKPLSLPPLCLRLGSLWLCSQEELCPFLLISLFSECSVLRATSIPWLHKHGQVAAAVALSPSASGAAG